MGSSRLTGLAMHTDTCITLHRSAATLDCVCACESVHVHRNVSAQHIASFFFFFFFNIACLCLRRLCRCLKAHHLLSRCYSFDDLGARTHQKWGFFSSSAQSKYISLWCEVSVCSSANETLTLFWSSSRVTQVCARQRVCVSVGVWWPINSCLVIII